jgi:phenylalanyl-tRNA synthetase alpha chain
MVGARIVPPNVRTVVRWTDELANRSNRDKSVLTMRPMTSTSAPGDATEAAPTALEAVLREVEAGHVAAFAACMDEQSLRAAHARLLGRSGSLTAALKEMGKLPPADRKATGQRINGIKAAVEKAFEARLSEMARAAREADLHALPFDLTLPGRSPSPRGHLHPVTQVREDILDVFRELGFVVAEGPQVEREEYNFTKLGFPPDHPAIDMQDTFWVKPPPHAPDARVLLRTHTSNMQIREMLASKPPMAVVSAGPVYRCDEDATHTPMFHQVEGFLIDRKVTFAHLKGVLSTFVARLFGERKMRFRPSYFPFVEPGTEVDMQCVFCGGTGCRLCKQTGWMEILGAGMIHPVVFEHCGIDPEQWTGFAFGTGIDRPAMLRYGIPDLRTMFENDVRFLTQF